MPYLETLKENIYYYPLTSVGIHVQCKPSIVLKPNFVDINLVSWQKCSKEKATKVYMWADVPKTTLAEVTTPRGHLPLASGTLSRKGVILFKEQHFAFQGARDFIDGNCKVITQEEHNTLPGRAATFLWDRRPHGVWSKCNVLLLSCCWVHGGHDTLGHSLRVPWRAPLL